MVDFLLMLTIAALCFMLECKVNDALSTALTPVAVMMPHPPEPVFSGPGHVLQYPIEKGSITP